MTGIEVPTRRDIEDLALRDVTLRHCLDVRIAAKMLTYEDALRIAVVELVREKRETAGTRLGGASCAVT